MKDVSECIGEIRHSGSCLFTTIDLTGGFWRMLLQPKSRPYTAFTVPGKGQFQWVTSPMGLLGCPSSFQRLMETVVHGLQNIIVYIDNLLVHSSTHSEHLALLDQLLEWLVQHNVKINLSKCFFRSKNVAYLGFRLTEEGVKPGSDKLKAIEKTSPPENVHEVRQLLGLCNFFCTHIRNFAQLTAPLTAMTQKDCGWKGGELPKAALQSFRELQSYLCSEPIVAYPRRNRTYTLITEEVWEPFSLSSTKKENTTLSHMPAENCKSTNAIIHLFYSRCKPLCGEWTISTHTWEAGRSFCSPTIDLWKNWVRCIQKP